MLIINFFSFHFCSDIYPSTIQVALDQFFEFEDINYTCEKCKGKEARLSHKFSKLSRFVPLCLRFVVLWKRYNSGAHVVTIEQ